MTAEAIAFPDAEAVLVGLLNPVLDVPVRTRVQNPRDESFVRLVRTGGARRDLVADSALVVFECWAPTEPEAAELARLCRARVHALARQDTSPTVYRVVEVGGPAYNPDPSAGVPRYTFSAQVDIRGAALA